jgi:hypothetical protein
LDGGKVFLCSLIVLSFLVFFFLNNFIDISFL